MRVGDLRPRENLLLWSMWAMSLVCMVQGFIDLTAPGQRYQNTSFLTIKDSYFEGPCVASWAMAPAMVASDEYSAKNSVQKRLSYQHLMECCVDCYSGYDNGCKGGNFITAMNYLNTVGTVTGSYMGFTGGLYCKNYVFRECMRDPSLVTSALPACTASDLNPSSFPNTCRMACDGGAYDTMTLIQLSTVNQVSNINYITNMENILNQGFTSARALVTEMQVYEDLYWYQPVQVYAHLWGRHIGSMAVAIYGYGLDPITNLTYWLVRLPFGSTFGNSGYMKVHKGVNAVGIEAPGNAYYYS